MKRPIFCVLGTLMASAAIASAAITTFSYTQTDSVTGAGARCRGGDGAGPVLVDNFSVEGLIEFDEANIAIIPEPGIMSLIALSGIALILRRRNHR